MQATVIYANNPFHPARNREIVSIKRKKRISALAPKRSEPFICLVNGKPLLRENNGWNRTVNDGEIVTFITLPQGGGGGGSNPLKIILSITIAIYATPLAAGINSSLGLGLSELGLKALAAGINFAGNALVNALVRDPSPSLSQRSIQQQQSASPTYNLSAQGNQARIGQAIPVAYGRNQIYMDFAAQPYTEYSGNEQFLYQLFCIGQGEYDIEQIRLEDSIVASTVTQDGEIYDANGVFEDIQYQVCFNEEITLFPANVVTSVEVSGQESLSTSGTYSQSGTTITVTKVNHGYDTSDAVYLSFTSGTAVSGFFQVASTPTADTFTVTASGSLTTSGNVVIVTVLGGFVVNAAGTDITAIGFDIVLPRGLYYANDSGGLDNVTVTYAGQYREIDDSGSPVGSWTDAFSQTVTLATTTPQRFSQQVGVATGRYEARFARTNLKQTDTRYGNDVNWAGLRGYIKGSQNYGNITMLAMKLKASNQLNQTSSRRINVVCTRMLPTWDGSTWTNAVATRNPAWAIADIVTASYGMGLSTSRIDGDQLLALSSVWASRGDNFDGIYDGQQPAWEALTQVARVGRAMPYLQSGSVYITRDSEESPVALFSMRNIAKNTFKMSYLMPNEETADAIDVEYWDNGTFQQKVVRAALPDSTESLVVKRQLFGCSSRDQAYREGMYMAAANRYRRRMVSFQTEMEGYIPTVGDLIAVQHDMPSWGYSGEVVEYDSATGYMRLSEPVSFDVGTYYIAFRNRDGSVSEAYEVERYQAPNERYYLDIQDISLTPTGTYTAVFSTDSGNNLGWLFASASAVTDYEVTLLETPSITIDFGIDRERTHFAFGLANSLYVTAKVLGIKPRGLERVEISCVVDSEFVYDADTGVAPTESAWQLPTRNTRPVLRGLIARSDPADVTKMFLSWEPSAGAERYLIEISDNGNGWTRIGDTSASSFTAIAQYGARTVIRVAAIGITRSAWVSVQYGSSADYMWDVDDTTLMWNVDDTTLMWT